MTGERRTNTKRIDLYMKLMDELSGKAFINGKTAVYYDDLQVAFKNVMLPFLEKSQKELDEKDEIIEKMNQALKEKDRIIDNMKFKQ